MIVELVSTGTELLLGQIVNTNAPYLAQKLNELGFSVLFQSTVGDNRERMTDVLQTALKRADIVITTGGLGPTQGDITKEVAAKILGRPLLLHEPSVKRIEAYFAKRNMPMPENNIRQAMIPQDGIVINNDRGTAPGVIVEQAGKTVIHLPGPPFEMEGMFNQDIIPYLVNRFGSQGVIVSKVLRTYGIGESALEERIKEYILAQKNPTIALLARSGEIHVRLTAKAMSKEEAYKLILPLEKSIRGLIGEYIFGVDDETLEQVVGKMLAGKGMHISFAESCTGGLISSLITDMPGSSGYLTGSVVCYSNEVKIDKVGVPSNVIQQYGAVSEPTAIHMAQGIRAKINTDIGVGVTGIAGPDGGSDEKPVGLVYIAIDGPLGVKCYKNNFIGHRTNIKLRTAKAALDIVRRYVSLL